MPDLYKEAEEPDYSITLEDYQATFSTTQGRRVLCHLLYEFGFFREALNDEQRIARNIMTRILKNMGIFQEKNFIPVTQALVNISLTMGSFDNKK